MIPSRRRALVGIGVPGLAVAAMVWLVSAPAAMLVVTAFRGPSDALPFEPGTYWTTRHAVTAYTDAGLYLTIVPDTLVFAGSSVLLGFVLAFGLAWLIERTDLPWREGFYTLVLVPFLVPTLVPAVAWILLLGPNAGWLNVALRSLLGLAGPGPLDIFSMPGLVVAQALASVPFLFILLSAVLRGMDPALEEASHVAGARPGTTFLRITVPLLRPGLLASLLLGAIITLEQFEMPLLIGLPARIHVFSAQIFWELNPLSGLPNYGRAAALALLFLVASLALLALYNRLIRRAERFVTVTGRGFAPRRLPLGRWRWIAVAAVLGFLAVSSGLPLFVLGWASLFGGHAPASTGAPAPSLAAYATLLADPTFHLALRNTLLVAATSASLVTAIGAVVAWILVRTRLPGRAWLDVASILSIGVPSVIAGLAVMLLYLTLPLGVYGTVWILVLAYSYRLAVATRLCRAGLMQIHPELEDASHAAGAPWGATFGRVVLPLMTPALLGAWLFLFIVGVREFTLPVLLASPDNVVLSVVLWRLLTDGHMGQVAALSMLVLLLVLATTVLLRRALLVRRRGR